MEIDPEKLDPPSAKRAMVVMLKDMEKTISSLQEEEIIEKCFDKIKDFWLDFPQVQK